MTSKIRLAAVGDSGALAPVARVARALDPSASSPAAVVVTIEPSCPLGEPLATVRNKLVAGEIDVALCPACRLPLALPQGIEVGAVLRCRDFRYQFVSLTHSDLSALATGGKVVVCDPGARAQVLHRFPSLVVTIAPPNEAIFAGLRHGVWDAACVPPDVVDADPSFAGHAAPIPVEEIVPCIGLGVIAVLRAATEGRQRESLRVLNDPAVEHCFRVERAFLARVAGVPGTIAAARALQREGKIELTGLLAEENGRWVVADQAVAPARFGETLALEIGDACRKLATGHSNAVRPASFSEPSPTVPSVSGRRARGRRS